MAFRDSLGLPVAQRYASINSSSLLAHILQSLLISSGQATPESSVNSPASKHASVSPTASAPSTDFSLFSQAFPFTPMGRSDDVQEMIRGHLPPWDRACALCDTYFEQAGWLFRGVTREQLIDDMLPAIYRKTATDEFAGPHDLALMFIIFAVGALVEAEPSTQHAEHYHQISRAAISLQAVLEKPSIVTIQCLHLMSIYNAMSGSDLTSETSMEMTWSLITLAAHLSQTVSVPQPLGDLLLSYLQIGLRSYSLVPRYVY